MTDQGRPGKGDWTLRVLAVLTVFAIVVSVLLELLNSPRGPHLEGRCINNLKQIGLALVMYAEDNGNWFPPDLYALYETGYLMDEPLLFCCPATGSRQHAQRHFSGRGDFVCDYWYRGPMLRPAEGEPPVPVAGDYAGNHPNGWGAVVFSDGYCEGHK